MSVALNHLSTLVGHVALNPVVSASLLWILTKGPDGLRDRLIANITVLRDPKRLAQVVKALTWCLAFGVTGVVNRRLNDVALNAGRWRSDKNKWNWGEEIAIITGGCSGIGELIVKRLVGRGIRVAVLDILDLPKSLQGYAHIKHFKCDVTDPEAVYATAEKIKTSLGAPSILINNAGILAPHTILNTPDEFLRKIFDVNVLSNWYTTKTFLPAMLASDHGHILTIASGASNVGIGGLADYSATKAAILSFHEALNQELRHHHNAPSVLTTSFHPGWVRTPLLGPIEQELKQRGATIIEPETVADAVMERILACKGGQVFLPAEIAKSSWLRGLPNWLQERARDGLSKLVWRSAGGK